MKKRGEGGLIPTCPKTYNELGENKKGENLGDYGCNFKLASLFI